MVMEITQEQFVTNFEALSEEDQNAVGVIFENNPPEVIISLASVFGVTLQSSGEQEPQEPMQEPQEPMPEPSEEMSEPEQEIPQTDEMSPIAREMMALGDQPTGPVATTGPIQKEGADGPVPCDHRDRRARRLSQQALPGLRVPRTKGPEASVGVAVEHRLCKTAARVPASPTAHGDSAAAASGQYDGDEIVLQN